MKTILTASLLTLLIVIAGCDQQKKEAGQSIDFSKGKSLCALYVQYEPNSSDAKNKENYCEIYWEDPVKSCSKWGNLTRDADICYASLINSTLDPSICERLSTKRLQEQCRHYVTKEWSEFVEMYKQHINDDVCQGLDGQHNSADNCTCQIRKPFAAACVPKSCLLIPGFLPCNGPFEDQCGMVRWIDCAIAVDDNNISQCSSYPLDTDKRAHDLCVFSFATMRKNLSSCDGISDFEVRAGCKTVIG